MSESERTRPRPSPRWREPLVEEFHAGDQTTSSKPSGTEDLGTTINGEEKIPKYQNGLTRDDDWKRAGQQGIEEEEEEERKWERKSWTKHVKGTNGLEKEEEEEERPFFSEEFYQAFPHLRPSTTSKTTSTTEQNRPFITSPSSTSDQRKRFSEARAFLHIWTVLIVIGALTPSGVICTHDGLSLFLKMELMLKLMSPTTVNALLWKSIVINFARKNYKLKR